MGTEQTPDLVSVNFSALELEIIATSLWNRVNTLTRDQDPTSRDMASQAALEKVQEALIRSTRADGTAARGTVSAKHPGINEK
jgi:hypothetical protein